MIKPFDFNTENKISKSSSNGNIKPFDFSSTGLSPLQNKLAGVEANIKAELEANSKFNLKNEAKYYAKEIPKNFGKVMKFAATKPFKAVQSATTGIADIGVGAVNLGLNIANKAGINDKNKRLEYLTPGFSEAQKTQELKDLTTGVSGGTKMWGGYVLGQGAVSGLGVKNKVAQTILGDVAGGQLTADSEMSGKDRLKQAAFDTAFGLITDVGIPRAYNKIVPNNKVTLPMAGAVDETITPPKQKLSMEEYSKSQGYEPIKSESQLPVIPFGKSKTEPVVKYGTNPKVFKGENTKPTIGLKNIDIPKDEPIIEFDARIKEKATPEYKTKIVDMADEINDFNLEPGIKFRQAAKFDEYITAGKDKEIMDIISGDITDTNLSPQTAHRLLESHYIKTGQNDKIKELLPFVDSVISKTGQDLSLLNSGLGKNSPTLNLKRAERILEDNLTKQGIDINTVKNEITTEINNALELVRNGAKPQDVVDSIIDKFTC